MPQTALIAGASGLVGGHCLRLLLDNPNYSRVVSIGRRNLDLESPKLEQHVVDFNDLEASATLFAVDHVFCCLGTTIRTAGSQAAFRRVDYDYPLEMARMSARQGVRAFAVVTAMGAARRSLFFYNRVKGQLEHELEALDIPSISVAQPSLLLGDRSENRAGEQAAQKLMQGLSPVFAGPLRKYKPIEGRQVAQAMIALAQRETPGFRRYASDVLQDL